MTDRSLLVKQLPCIACTKQGVLVQCGVTEAHHLNLGGRAGQKRRGDDYQIPLGTWHHRGVPPAGMSRSQALHYFGPSLASHSKAFRSIFGVDEVLLADTNEQLLKLFG